MNFDWYPWYVQSWRKNTMHLGLAEDGAYRRLIDEYMMTRAPLPDNDAALARIVGVGLDEWLTVAPKVRAFFVPSSGKLTHERCEEELHAQACQAHATSIKNKAAANSRWDKYRKTKELHALAYQPHAPRMPNDATRQDITITSSERANGKDGLLATALPDGRARSPSSKIEPSPSLQASIAAKGWRL